MINPRYTVKQCRICGDKATAFNFNGLTCESCKIFFRRNGGNLKKLKCIRNGSCEINIVNRKDCSACRLEKCLSIGMRFKDKTVKTLEKNNTFLDNSSETDKILLKNDQINLSSFSNQTSIPSQTQLDYYEMSHLLEIQNAISIFKNENSVPSAGHTESAIKAFNLPCNYARHIVKFCKNISAYRQLCREDQFAMLKPFIFEICFIRFAFYYDLNVDGVPMYANETGSQVLLASFKMFDNFENYDTAINNKKLLLNLGENMENDLIIRDLIIAQFLFKRRENVTCPEFLRYRYFVYGRLLLRYLKFKHKSTTQAELKYEALMAFLNKKMEMMRDILIKLLKELDIGQISHLTVEVFNLK